MNHIDQGGSAFPHSVAPGMTLRDYLAAEAVNGIISHNGLPRLGSLYELAQRAYEVADAMMKARKQ